MVEVIDHGQIILNQLNLESAQLRFPAKNIRSSKKHCIDNDCRIGLPSVLISTPAVDHGGRSSVNMRPWQVVI